VPTPNFIKSAAAPKDFPADEGREVAFVGRSNSGKSTALNLLAGVRKLARVSKTPGRTQLVNFFGVGDERRLVDLPGYGFARVAPGTQESWRELIETYLTTRRSLAGLVVTIDIRRGITDLDDALLHWLEPLGLQLGLLLTKADKLGHGAGLAREREIAAGVAHGTRLTRFSALNRIGVDVARGWIDDWMHRDVDATRAPEGGSSDESVRWK
jgi:GTP-binding protein